MGKDEHTHLQLTPEKMNLNEYLLNFSQEQDPVLQWLQKQTNLRTNHARMLCGPVEGKLIEMISAMIQPKNILEIGAFTGYSAICLASSTHELGLRAGEPGCLVPSPSLVMWQEPELLVPLSGLQVPPLTQDWELEREWGGLG